jgi:hypothetical protein
MRYLLDFGDDSEMVRCRDAHQALQLARLFVAWQTGQPALLSPVAAIGTVPRREMRPARR